MRGAGALCVSLVVMLCLCTCLSMRKFCSPRSCDHRQSSFHTLASLHCRPIQAMPHEPDPQWRLQDHLSALRGGSKGGDGSTPAVASWRDIFWDIWGVVHVLYCHHCLSFFPAQVREGRGRGVHMHSLL